MALSISRRFGLQCARLGLRASIRGSVSNLLNSRLAKRGYPYAAMSRNQGLHMQCASLSSSSLGSTTDDLSNYKSRNYAFQIPVMIRWGDMDAFGHVNNVVYFRYFEQARVEHFRGCGLHMDVSAPGKSNPVLGSTYCRYRAMVVEPCDIVVGVSIGEVSESSMVHHYVVYNKETRRVVAEGEAEIVFLDFSTGKRAPIPEVYLSKSLELHGIEATQK